VKSELAAEGIILDQDEEEFLALISKMNDKQRAQLLEQVKAAAAKTTH